MSDSNREQNTENSEKNPRSAPNPAGLDPKILILNVEKSVFCLIFINELRIVFLSNFKKLIALKRFNIVLFSIS